MSKKKDEKSTVITIESQDLDTTEQFESPNSNTKKSSQICQITDLERRCSIETIQSHLGKRIHYIDDLQDSQDEKGDLQDGSNFVEFDPELVTWDGDQDPENPRHWPSRTKWLMVSVVAMYGLISPLSSSIIAPAVSEIARDLNIDSSVERSMVVSIFVLAWAICPLFTAPFSELWGRRLVLNISILLLVVFNMACALARSKVQLMVFRFLAGCAGAPPLSIAAGTLADLFSDRERNTALAWFALGPTVGPVIAPIVGSFVVEGASWRWVLWVLTIATGATAAFGWAVFKETYPPTLLHWKAEKLRKETGNPNLHTIYEVTSSSFKSQLLVAITRPIRLLTLHPIVLGLGLHLAFIYGFMYLLLVTYPALWTQYYGYSTGIAGLMYLGVGIGFFIGMPTWTPLVQIIYLRLTKRNNDEPKPEYRLPLLLPSTFCMGIGLIWYGWAAEYKTFWLVPLLGTGLYAFGIIGLFQTIQNYLIDMNPLYSASSIAAALVFRSLFAFFFPLFGQAMYNRLGYGWANTICGVLCFILGIPFPIAVYVWGERLRKWADKRFV